MYIGYLRYVLMVGEIREFTYISRIKCPNISF